MMSQRRTYSREFRLAAVKKVIEHGLSVEFGREGSWCRCPLDSQLAKEI